MNRDLTTGVLKIRTKKETIKGERDCKGTLDRLLGLFFSDTFNQTAPGLSEDTTTGGLASTAGPITKSVIQRDRNRVPLHCYGSRESTDNDTIHTLYN